MKRWALTLLVAGLGLAGLVAGCGSTSGGGDTGATWIPGMEGAKSGEIEAQLLLHGPAVDGRLFWRLLGKFLGAGEGKLPQIEMVAEAIGKTHGAKTDFLTALSTGRHRAAVTFGGQDYEVDPKTFESIAPSFEQALGDGTAADPYACLEAAAKIDLSQITGKITARDPNATADDGTKVTTVTTVMMPSTLSDVLDRLSKDPGCGAQLRAVPPLRRQLEVIAGDVERTMKKAEAETFVDKNGLLRELRINAVLDWKGKEADAAFVYSLSYVNEITELISSSPGQSIKVLFHELGFNPLKAIEAGAPGLGGLLEGIYGS
ncbi:MAG: hypothetical protein ACTHKT_05130 [Solirubrobacterales bacterium]